MDSRNIDFNPVLLKGGDAYDGMIPENRKNTFGEAYREACRPPSAQSNYMIAMGVWDYLRKKKKNDERRLLDNGQTLP